jgi:DUF4097 and DUF4098 domain-containing protein YvlB
MATRKPAFIGALLAGLALALSACTGGNVTAEEIVAQSFDTSASPRVVVETFNGHIEVAAGAEADVLAEVTKRGAGFSLAGAEDDLKNVEVTMTQEGDTVRIVARRTGGPQLMGNSGASIELTVPAGASLDLHTSNGHIGSNGVTGDISMDTSNGALEVDGGGGRIDLSTSNGRIDVEARDAVVDARTSNGRIGFRGSLAEGNHGFRTSNGRIEITLPSSAQFRIDASTSNGDVSTEFPVSRSGSTRDEELHGVVGENPDASITATTSNGDIDIRRGE